MTMTLEEQRDIIQAAIDGKRVEYNWRDTAWVVLSHAHRFNFDDHDYRIVKTGRDRLEEDMRDVYKIGSPLTYKMICRDVLDGKYGKLRDD